MTPRQKVYYLAKQLGADVEESTVGRYLSINVLAPIGKRFALNDTHAMAETAPIGGNWTREAWQDMALRLQPEYLEECPVDCECRD